ncbi:MULTISPECIES: flagellar basal body-associated FliL family protein [Methylocaldum]|uniref:flagellar basal body-associated FliL family protein n=1 Tax=unclassified Methylocaldum TaxID=2622260 RepID=UPI000989BFE8|nr:flagellar basal body-associated FliL family protein [Methylocaldum sp. 14B]MDV3241153.1 flagellar basal body-associated FliL family protein [Methylocaldum sp.]MVF20906.1 flagellar basal body protein FliL [Methylocaldum sp. BRCS4]
MAQQDKLDLGEEKKKSSKSVIFIVLGAMLGTLLAVFAALYFWGIFPPKQNENEAAAESRDGGALALPMIYFAIDPAFVVNFKSNPDARLLQVGLSVASKNQAVIDAVKKHSPMIRNNVLLLLSGQEPAGLKTAEGKEALRGKLLEEINAVVSKQTGHKEGAEEVFFTGFIMQ